MDEANISQENVHSILRYVDTKRDSAVVGDINNCKI